MLAPLARRAIALLLLLVAPRAAAAQDDVALVARIEAWFAEAQRLAPGTWGVAIADQRGTMLWSHNATEPMVPASTVKLLTTGYARTVLGPDARIATRVVGEGRLLPATGE
ncbi:MAG: D-alanyl-D-alanine carboxypeptidase, partial [Gemmatimonadales bacterium]|nr:D-alanyl-D-alanine carboxypeptidase [Gemmatimonadales bacterium]